MSENFSIALIAIRLFSCLSSLVPGSKRRPRKKLKMYKIFLGSGRQFKEGKRPMKKKPLKRFRSGNLGKTGKGSRKTPEHFYLKKKLILIKLLHS